MLEAPEKPLPALVGRTSTVSFPVMIGYPDQINFRERGRVVGHRSRL